MKGPGFRLDLDVRRVWECPACSRRLKFDGSVTQVACDCRGEASPMMRLVEPIHRTESPFDHIGHAAQKRIDAALRKPDGTCDAEPPDESEDQPLDDVLTHEAPLDDPAEDRRPPDDVLPETTHELDADAPPPTAESSDEPPEEESLL